MKKLVLYFLFIITNFLNAQCWQKVSMGSHHALAIKNDGSLWSWGANFYGQLGDGTSVSKSSPVQIGFSQDWSVISAGAGHSMAIKNDGTLWAWGFNKYGQLGDGTHTDKNIPTQIGQVKD